MNIFFWGMPAKRRDELAAQIYENVLPNNAETRLSVIKKCSDVLCSSSCDVYICVPEGVVNKTDGLSFAKKVRSENKNAEIIFMSNSLLYITEILHSYIRPTAYFLFSEPDATVVGMIKKIFSINSFVGETPAKVEIVCEYKKQFISINQILYFTSSNKKIICHLENGEELSFYDTLGELEQRYSAFFMRVHSGFLVNVNKIAKVNLTENALDLAGCCYSVPISRKYKPELKKAMVSDIVKAVKV